MKVERTAAGLEARLDIYGIGRFVGAAFLLFWLAGWAVGECFALWILGKGAWSLFTGEPQVVGHKPVEFGVAIGVGLFLVVWVVFWTIGGLAAGRELLRLLFGRDILVVRHDGIEIKRSYGFFRSLKRLRREEIRRFYRTSTGGPLCVETTRGKKTVVTSLGTPDERAELERALNEQLHLEAQPTPAGALPKGWCEVLSLEREAVLVKDPAVRRKHARTAWLACAALSLIPLYLLSQARERPDLLAALLFFVALAGGVGWGAFWLSSARNEWRPDNGRLILQRRLRGNRTQRFEAVSLELVEDNSGDNGTSYVLTAVAAGAPAGIQSRNTGQHRRTIHSQTDDPAEPRNLGVWLSQRCQIPFLDLTTAQAKAVELETLKQQLAGSGRLGRAALLVIDRLAPSPPGPKEKTGTSL